jgi:hypothetical protein
MSEYWYQWKETLHFDQVIITHKNNLRNFWNKIIIKNYNTYNEYVSMINISFLRKMNEGTEKDMFISCTLMKPN